MPLSFVVEALNVGDIFPFLLDNVSIGICCKEVMAITLFSPFVAPKTSSVVLVLFCQYSSSGGKIIRGVCH